MTPSQNIDARIAELADWRGGVYAELRKLINEADPGLKEDWKWGTAVWNNGKNVCAVGAFKDKVKLNFFKGASITDPNKLFNAGLESKESRSIDFAEGEKIDTAGMTELIRIATELS